MRLFRRPVPIALLLVFGVLGTGEVRAAAPPSSNPAKSKDPKDEKAGGLLAREALELYRKGKILEAAELFLRAYELSGRSPPLRNAAKSFEECGHFDEAKVQWGRYRDRPDATFEERSEAETHIALIDEKVRSAEALRQAEEAKKAAAASEQEAREAREREAAARTLAQQRPAPDLRPQSDPTTSNVVAVERPTSDTPVAQYALIGGGAAAALTSGILFIVAVKKTSSLDSKLATKNQDGLITGITPDGVKSEVSSINGLRVASGVLLGAGLLAAGIGAAWLLGSGGSSSPGPRDPSVRMDLD